MIYQVERSHSGQRAAIDHCLQIVGLGQAVLDVEVAAQLHQIGVILLRNSFAGVEEFADVGELIQQVHFGQLAVAEIEIHVSVEALGNVAAARRRKTGVGVGGQHAVERVFQRRNRREQLVGVNFRQLAVESVGGRVGAHVHHDRSCLLAAEQLSNDGIEAEDAAVNVDFGIDIREN